MDDMVVAENVLEYVVAQCKGKDADEMMDIMLGVLGQMKEHKFEKMARELGIFTPHQPKKNTKKGSSPKNTSSKKPKKLKKLKKKDKKD